MKVSLLSFLAVFILGAALAGCTRTRNLTVYYTNEIEGFYWPHATEPSGKEYGGFAVLKKYLQGEQQPYLLLGGGDWFLGTPEGAMSKGRTAVELMSLCDYDAVGLGANDFAFGWQSLQTVISSSTLPVVAYNVSLPKDKKNPVHNLVPYVLKDVGGIKVAVIGVLGRPARNEISYENVAGVKLRSETEGVAELIRTLREKEQVKLVIVLASMGSYSAVQKGELEDEKAFLREVPGVDLLFSGTSSPQLAHPVRSGNSYIVQSKARLTAIGRLDLNINSFSGKITGMDYKLVELDKSKYGEDSVTAKYVAELREQVNKKLGRKIGRSKARLTRTMTAESLLGDWTSDCLKRWAKANVGLINSSALKSDMPEGPLTERQTYEIYPSDDNVMILRMRGSDIRQVIEGSLSNAGDRLQIGGAKVLYNPSAREGERVSSITIENAPISDTKIYRVAATDFMMASGEGYYELSHAIEFANTKENVRRVIGWCIGRQSVIETPETGRWIESSDRP